MTPDQLQIILRNIFKHEGIITETYTIGSTLSKVGAGNISEAYIIPIRFGPIRLRKVVWDYKILDNATGYLRAGELSWATLDINRLSGIPFGNSFSGVPAMAFSNMLRMFNPGSVMIEELSSADDLNVSVTLHNQFAGNTDIIYSLAIDVERLIN